MNVTHFRELDVWRVAMELTKAVYKLTALFPRAEQYGLTAQLQRAAVSVPSNIAEGNARNSKREYIQFLSIASGSVAEVQTQLLLASDLGLVGQERTDDALALAERISQMLYRLQQSLSRGIANRSRDPGPGSRVPIKGVD